MTGPFVRLTWRYNSEVLQRDDHVWVNIAHVQTMVRSRTAHGEPYTAIGLVDWDSPLEVMETPEEILRQAAAWASESVAHIGAWSA